MGVSLAILMASPSSLAWMASLQDIAHEPMRGLCQPVIVRPQGVAAMMLSASEVQRVRCPQTEVAAQLGGLQIHRLGHVQRGEPVEQIDIGVLQNRVAALDGPDQTLAFDQRRDAEADPFGLADSACDRFAPPRMMLGEVDYQAGIANRGEPVVRLVPAGPAPATRADAGSGRAILNWLKGHPLPAYACRSAEEIDASIRLERSSWD